MKTAIHTIVFLIFCSGSSLFAQQNWGRHFQQRSIQTGPAQRQFNWGQANGQAGVHFNEVQAGRIKDLQPWEAGVQAQANLFRANASGNVQTNPWMVGGRRMAAASANGQAEYRQGANAAAQGGLNFNGSNPQMYGKANAFLGHEVNAQGNAKAEFGGFNYGANGSATAGTAAYGDAEAGLGANGLNAKLGGFVGNRATAEGGFDVSGLGGKGVAEAWNGVGVDGDLNATIKNGKLKMKVGLGAGLGIGGKLGGEITIDGKEIANGARNFANSVESAYNEVAPEVERGLQTAGREVVSGLNTAGRQIENGVTTAANEVANTATSAAREVERGVNTVGREIESGAKTVGREIENGAKSVGNEIEKGAKSVANFFGF